MVECGVTADTSAWEPIAYAADLQPLYSEFGDYPSHAFVRELAPGVEYHQPASIGGLRTWLHRKVEWQSRYLMPYPGEVPPTSEDLLDIQARFAGQRATLKDGDAALTRLDAIIDQFLGLVCELHENQMPLGFVNPRSVRFVRDASGSETVQLPDLGFVFNVNSRAAALPKWLEDPSMNVLFDSGAEARNEAYYQWICDKSHANFETLAFQDVKIVGRLIAFALAGESQVRRWGGGECLHTIPPPAGTLNDTACGPVWDAVSRAISGETLSVAELREALRREDARPSRHFLVKPPKPPPHWVVTLVKRIAKPALASAAALLVAGATWAAWQAFGPRYTSICPHVWSWNRELYPSLVDLESQKGAAAANDVAKQRFRESLKQYVQLLRSSASHPCDGSCTDTLVALTEPWIDDEVDGTLETLRLQPRQNDDEVAILTATKAIVDELNSLRRETSPPLFQSAAQTLDRQLSLRGAAEAAGDRSPVEDAKP
jgi:hypothetical protein